MKKKIKITPIAVVYFLLRAAVIAVGVRQFINHEYANVFLCVLTLFLFFVPSILEKHIKIDVPDLLETIILCFIFAAEILGEIKEYYVNVPGWDTMLHTTWGFLCAAIGLALIDIINKSDRFSVKLSPFFVALFAFCFSMTIGVLWEFFEFSADRFLGLDMQKDTWVSVINSVSLDPNGRNIPYHIDIQSVVVNGQTFEKGYLDIGLIDTMKDLFVNFIGATVFAVIGFFYAKSKGTRNRPVKHLLLKWQDQK